MTGQTGDPITIPVPLSDLHRLDSLLSLLHSRHNFTLGDREQIELEACRNLVRRLTATS